MEEKAQGALRKRVGYLVVSFAQSEASVSIRYGQAHIESLNRAHTLNNRRRCGSLSFRRDDSESFCAKQRSLGAVKTFQ